MIPGRPSDTAQVVCLIRALDAAWRGERSLIKDVHARRFLTPAYASAYAVYSNSAGRAALLPARWLFNWIIHRHTFIDQLVRDHGTTMPIVLLGAGYDSRALRLSDSIGKGFYEIDFASTQARKRSLAEAAGIEQTGVQYIAADFAVEPLDDIFARTGLRDEPVLIVWEGVSMYLEEEVVRDTLEAAGGFFANGTILVADFWTSGLGRASRRLPALPIAELSKLVLPEPFLFATSPDEVVRMAEGLGVARTEIHSDADIAAQFASRRSLIRSPYFVATFTY